MKDFTAWAAAGFAADLIPIIPPDAPLSPSSKIRPKDLGKIPGRQNGQGTWSGFDWWNHKADEHDLATWTASGAGIGLRARTFPGLDIDVLDEDLAGLIEAEAKRTLGPAPVRTGRAPKRLLAYRTTKPFGRIALRFKAPDDERAHLIELLGSGRQYVVEGEHPVTRQPYTWSEHPTASALVEIDQTTTEAFFDAAAVLLDLLGCIVLPREHAGAAADRSKIDQETLRGDPDRLDEALTLIPNDNEWFPDRDDYIAVGIAIKAAYGPDEEERAQERWIEWCAKWEGNPGTPGGNDLEAARTDWTSFKAPFAIGADYIFRLAAPFGFNAGRGQFEAFGPPPDPDHDHDPDPDLEPTLPPIRPINFTTRPDTPPPPREFLVDEWLPAGILTSLYGPPGVGKSLLAQQIATCLAADREVFGFKVKPAPVLALFSEDDNEELERRQWRINREYDLKNEDLGRLHIEGRSGQLNAIVTFPSNAPRVELLAKSVVAKARELNAGLIVLDNRAQMILGNENDRMVATYGGNLCSRIGHRAGAAVLLVGHPAKLAGSEYSGSTAWDAVTRSRWLLRRVEVEDEDENAPAELIWTLAKSNYAPPGRSLTLVWVSGVLRLASALSAEQLAEAEFHREAARQAFLECLDQLTSQGRAVSHGKTTRNYAPRVIAEMLEGFTRSELEQVMEDLFMDGMILANMPVGRNISGHRTYGIARAAERGPE